jgi:hypothetical protein
VKRGKGEVKRSPRGGISSIPCRAAFGDYFLVAFLTFNAAFSAFAAEWFLLWRATAFAISSEESLR